MAADCRIHARELSDNLTRDAVSVLWGTGAFFQAALVLWAASSATDGSKSPGDGFRSCLLVTVRVMNAVLIAVIGARTHQLRGRNTARRRIDELTISTVGIAGIRVANVIHKLVYTQGDEASETAWSHALLNDPAGHSSDFLGSGGEKLSPSAAGYLNCHHTSACK